MHFHVMNIALYFFDGLLVLQNNAFHIFPLTFCHLDSQGLKVTRSNDLVIYLAQILFVYEHGMKALLVDCMTAPESFHQLTASCFAFEAHLFWKDFVADDAQFDCVLACVEIFQGWEEVNYKLLPFKF